MASYTRHRKRARYDACYDAFRIGYQFIWGVLYKIKEDSSEKAETEAKAAGTANMFGKFNMALLLNLGLRFTSF